MSEFTNFYFRLKCFLWALGFFWLGGIVFGQSTPCDDATQTFLKTTQISTHDVTEGEVGKIYFNNSVLEGMSYYAISPTGQEFRAVIEPLRIGSDQKRAVVEVGAITSPQTFTFKAIGANGCVFDFTEQVSIAPITIPTLVARVVDEHCNGTGSIFASMEGAGISNDDYDFFVKYPRTATHLPLTDLASGLIAVNDGQYEIKAKHKVSGKEYEKTFTIADKVQIFKFTPVFIPSECEPNTAKVQIIYSDVHSYPIEFLLKDNAGRLYRDWQTSPIFENVVAGNYRIEVRDGCGEKITTGPGTTISVANNDPFNIWDNRSSANSISIEPADPTKNNVVGRSKCFGEKMVWQQSFTFNNLHWVRGTIPYPLEVTYKFTDPKGKVYEKTRTFNSNQEMNKYFSGSDNMYAYNSKSGSREPFMDEELMRAYYDDSPETWQVDIKVRSVKCDREWNIHREHTFDPQKAERDRQNMSLVLRRDSCGRPYLVTSGTNFSGVLVLEQYPTEVIKEINPQTNQEEDRKFSPEGAGFINTHQYGYAKLNHSMNGGTVVDVNNLLPGTYRVKFIHACGDEVVKEITVDNISPVNPTGSRNNGLEIYASCAGDYKAYFTLSSTNLPNKITITEFTPKIPGQVAPFTIPWEITPKREDLIDDRKILISENLPEGTYKYSMTGFGCAQDLLNENIIINSGERPTITVITQNCSPVVSFRTTQSSTANTNYYYYLQGYNEISKKWVNPDSPDSSTNTMKLILSSRTNHTLSLAGTVYNNYRKFRIIERRRLDRNLAGNDIFGCNQVVAEFEKQEERPRVVSIFGSLCSSTGLYRLFVKAEGGTTPYTYEVTHRNKVKLDPVQEGRDGVFDITETSSSAEYTFTITDACGNKTTIDRTLNHFDAFFITKDRDSGYCEGGSAELSVEDYSFIFNYKWYLENEPATILSTAATLNIETLEAKHFNQKIRLEITTKNPDQQHCFQKDYEVALTKVNGATLPTLGAVQNLELCKSEFSSAPYRNILNVKDLFPGYPDEGVITHKGEAINIPTSGQTPYQINMSSYVGTTQTFVYTYISSCGQKLVKEATFTLKDELGSRTASMVYCVGSEFDLDEVERRYRLANPIYSDASRYTIKWYSYDNRTRIYTELTNRAEKIETTGNSTSVTIYAKVNATGVCESPYSSVTLTKKDIFATSLKDENVLICPASGISGANVQDAINSLKNVINSNDYVVYRKDTDATGKETYVKLALQHQLSVNETYVFAIETAECKSEKYNLKVTIAPPIEITTQPIESTFCSNQNIQLSVVINDNNLLSNPNNVNANFRWYEVQKPDDSKSADENYGITPATRMHRHNSQNMNISNNSERNEQKKRYFYVEIQGKCQTIRSEIVEVLVKPILNGNNNNTITIQACEGDTIDLSTYSPTVIRVPANKDKGISHTWEIKSFPTTLTDSKLVTDEPGKVTIGKTSNKRTYDILQVIQTIETDGEYYCSDKKVITYNIQVKKKIEDLKSKTIYRCVNDWVDYFTIFGDGYINSGTTKNTFTVVSGDNLVTRQSATSNWWRMTAVGEVKVKQVVEAGNFYCADPAQQEIEHTIIIGVPDLKLKQGAELTYCPTITQEFIQFNDLVEVLGDLRVRWFTTEMGGSPITNQDLLQVDTKQTSAFSKTLYGELITATNSCISSKRLPVTIKIEDANAPTMEDIAPLVISCEDTDINDKIKAWIDAVSATENCMLKEPTTAKNANNIAHDYTAPTGDWCDISSVDVSFTATDLFNNTTTKTGKILVMVAKDDDYSTYVVNKTQNDVVVKDVTGTEVSILTNDKYKGATPSLNEVEISTGEVKHNTTVVTDNKVSIDATTGRVKVASDAPAGIYTLKYSFCDKTITPKPCSNEATITVVVKNVIDAKDNTIRPTFTGVVGGTTDVSILGDDTRNGVILPETDRDKVTLTIISVKDNDNNDASNKISIINTEDEGKGKVKVEEGTPSGTYKVNYKICDKYNTDVCDTATETIEIINPIVANEDYFTKDKDDKIINGTKEVTTKSVLDEDTFVGKKFEDESTLKDKITLTFEEAKDENNQTTSQVVMNNDGTITIKEGTPAGTYKIKYKICENGALPENCQSTTATIVVTAPEIVAKPNEYTTDPADNTKPIVGNKETTLPSILDNDTLGGKLLDGKPNNLSADKVKIEVKTGTATPVTGSTPQFKLLQEGVTTQPDKAPVLNTSTGVIVVPQNTPAGTYTLKYNICEVVNATNCSEEVEVKVVVTAPEIVAKPNEYTTDPADNIKPIVGNKETILPSILDNDTLGGKLLDGKLNNLSADKVKIEVKTGTATPVTGSTPQFKLLQEGVTTQPDKAPVLNTSTGVIVVPQNTPAGTYTLKYKICEVVNAATNCSEEVKVKVVVTALEIVATENHFTQNPADNTKPISSEERTELPSILNDDTLGGKLLDGKPNNLSADKVKIEVEAGTATPVTGSTTEVKLLQEGVTTQPDKAPVLNTSTGVIVVPQGTPTGTYTLKYGIVEVGNSTNKSEKVEVKVVVTNPIEATDDSFTKDKDNKTINGDKEVKTKSVLDQDTFVGTKFEDEPTLKDKIALTFEEAKDENNQTTSQVVMNNDGTITIKRGTPAGTYTIKYKICENGASPENCEEATATIVVTALEIVATENHFTQNPADNTKPISSEERTELPSILNDDTLGGKLLDGKPNNLSADKVKIKVETGTATELPSGNYTLTPPSGVTTTTLPELNTSTGVIVVPQGTPAGTYTLRYRISEVLNPSNQSEFVDVSVVVDKIVTTPITKVVGRDKGDNFSILDKIKVDNQTPNIGDITITDTTTPTSTGKTPKLDPTTGNVKVEEDTPAGEYDLTYKVCTTEGICTTSTIKVIVIEANDDSITNVNGNQNNPDVLDILGGRTPDKVGTSPATLDTNADNGVTIKVVPTDSSPTQDETGTAVKLTPADTKFDTKKPYPTLNTETGKVSVPQGTPAGTYTLKYQICQSGVCDEAEVSVEVKGINANPDTFKNINGTTGTDNAGNVVTNNDTLNGNPITDITKVAISVLTPATPNTGSTLIPTLDTTTGIVSVPAGTPSGDYTIKYQICDVANAGRCSDAEVKVEVRNPIVATNDRVTIDGNKGGTSVSVLGNDTLSGTTPSIKTQVDISVVTPATSVVGAKNDLVPTLKIDTDKDTAQVEVPQGTPKGTYTITYRICERNADPENCKDATITIEVTGDCELTFYNAISTNGDASNDTFVIEGIECYPDNELKIFNRWGVLVYEQKGYDQSFRGYSNGRVTINRDEPLPNGTYYYIFEYRNSEGETKRKAGWLYKSN